MKTLLLHIGTAKTGTSSIQESLARAQDLGAIRPVRFPMPWRERDHFRLGTLYLPYERLPRVSQKGRARVELSRRLYRRALFNELRPAHNAILSSEMMPILNTAEARKLRRDLEAAGFRKFIIVLYVRDPADFYVSRIQQDLKVSSRLRDPMSFRYPFREVSETWEQVFPGSVIVRRYVDNPEYDVVQDFSGVVLEHFGVELPRLSVRMNATISAEGMEILQRYRASFWSELDGMGTPDTNLLVTRLQQSCSEIRQTAPALRPEIAAHIRANHRADAEFIRERYGMDLELANAREPRTLNLDRTDRVADVLQGVDLEVVTELLLRVARPGLNVNPAARLRRLAARVSKFKVGNVPRPFRPPPATRSDGGGV